MDTIHIKSDEICPRKETWSSFDILSRDTCDTRDTEQNTSYYHHPQRYSGSISCVYLSKRPRQSNLTPNRPRITRLKTWLNNWATMTVISACRSPNTPVITTTWPLRVARSISSARIRRQCRPSTLRATNIWPTKGRTSVSGLLWFLKKITNSAWENGKKIYILSFETKRYA